MEAGMDSEVEKLREAVEQFTVAAKNLGAVSSTSGVHFHGSAGLTIVAVVAILLALFGMAVTAIWRAADMREINAIQQRATEDRQVMREMQAQSRTDRLLIGTLKDRITKVEAE
jgi:hypothetical protein